MEIIVIVLAVLGAGCWLLCWSPEGNYSIGKTAVVLFWSGVAFLMSSAVVWTIAELTTH
jgi:hypothetical protein